MTPYLQPNPTPPSIDIYPGDPFQSGAGFRDGDTEFWTVRARDTTADRGRPAGAAADAGPGRPGLDPTTIDDAPPPSSQEGVTGYRVYLEDGRDGSLIGCEWRVSVNHEEADLQGDGAERLRRPRRGRRVRGRPDSGAERRAKERGSIRVVSNEKKKEEKDG